MARQSRRSRQWWRWRQSGPELVAIAVVVLAWLALLAGGRPSDPSMPGMAMGGSGGPGTVAQVVLHALPWLLVMTIATMGPAALAGVRRTGIGGQYRRRWRALVEYAAAYLTIWLAFGSAALAAVALLPRLPGRGALCLVLLVAAGWQFTPHKRRWLLDGHRRMPVPPRGWRAEPATFRFGARNGLSCLGSCWCLMLLMNVAPGPGLLCGVLVSGVATTERILPRPGRASRLAGVALGVAGLWTLILGLG